MITKNLLLVNTSVFFNTLNEVHAEKLFILESIKMLNKETLNLGLE